MAELKLPVIEAHESPQEAIDKMRAWKRSAIVVRGSGDTHAMIRTRSLMHAIEANVQQISEAAGLTRLGHANIYRSNIPVKLMHIDFSGATLAVRDDLLTMYESAPSVCRCSHQHDGSYEGEICKQPENGEFCGRTVHCKDL